MAKDIDEKIGARSQKNWHGLKYKIPLKNYRVHEMPTGDQLRSFAVNGRCLHDHLRQSHGRRAFSCDKWYISRKLVSQV